MPDLCPNGIDLGVKTSAPSCPPMRGRIGDKEIRKTGFSNLSLGSYACKGQPERLRNSHTSCCLSRKHPPGKITNPSELIILFLQEIQKIKEDLGNYLEDPEKYIRAFKGVTQLYDLTWNDVMYILGQTLTSDSKTQALKKDTAYGDEWLGNESAGKREDNIAILPTGNQVVPTTEPDCDYNMAKVRWNQGHFVRCILEGHRRAYAKTLNYAKLANIEQEEKEAPGKFLDRLQEALHRFTK